MIDEPMTKTEADALVDAIDHNCECQFGPMGVRLSVCGSHRLAATDSNIVNRLVFWRRQRVKLLAQEMSA